MDYIMDTPTEGQRIERKTDVAMTRQVLERLGVGPGLRVADIGCAAGTTCRIMASLVGPSGTVLGVDASAERIEEAKGFDQEPDAAPIEYRIGEAAALPIDDRQVDLCWSRFLFEYLPDPPAALAEMVRVTRPGGAVIVGDLDGNCIWHDPIDTALEEDIRRALATLGGGFDPSVGRKLFGWFADAGLRDVAVDVKPYHLIAGTIDDHAAEHWRMKLHGVSAALIARGWDREDAEDLTRRFMAHLQDPETFTYSVLVKVFGRKPLDGHPDGERHGS